MPPIERLPSRRCAALRAASEPVAAALLLLLSALTAFACGPSGRAASAPDISAPRFVVPPLEGDDPPGLSDPLAGLLARVARVRGIEAGAAPELVALPARELARRALDQVLRDVPEPARRAQADLLLRLQLAPADFDLLRALEAALAGRLEAFYVGAPPRIFIDRALRGAARQRALAHELVHALQDRQHALVQRLEYEPDSWDRKSALHALAEADALEVVEQLGLPDAAEAARELEPESGAGVPGVLYRSLAAPYLDARALVRELLARGGFAAVDAELRAPPPSTHELLHPGSPPGQRLAPFRAPGSGWRPTYADVLGEQSLRSVLEEWAPQPEAAALAASWVADRLSSFERDGATALAWEMVFEPPGAAQKIFRLLVAALGLHPPSPALERRRAAAPVTEWSCGAEGDIGVLGASRRGGRLWFLALGGVPNSASCAGLEAWLKPAPPDLETRVPVASPVSRHPAKQPSGELEAAGEGRARRPGFAENLAL